MRFECLYPDGHRVSDQYSCGHQVNGERRVESMSAVLVTKGISKTYGNEKVKVRALRSCSMAIEKGEFVAIVGKSGSGKSTLLRILGTCASSGRWSRRMRGRYSWRERRSRDFQIRSSRGLGDGESDLSTRITACSRSLRRMRISPCHSIWTGGRRTKTTSRN